MSASQHNENSEEKWGEKREDEVAWVCGWDDWWSQDQADAVGWGAYFIWGALVILAQITDFSANFEWWNGWAVFFIGAGIITLVETAFRLVVPKYRRRWAPCLVWAFIMLAIGFGSGGWEIPGWFWVLALALVGIVILIGAFAKRSST